MPATKPYETKTLGAGVDAVAPDGTAVRLLLSLAGGSMAHFELPAGGVSHAVTHRTVEEIWFVVSGQGSIWRRQEGLERNRPARAGDGADHSARDGVSVSRRGRLGSRVRGDHHAALAWHGGGSACPGPLDADCRGRLRLKRALARGSARW